MAEPTKKKNKKKKSQKQRQECTWKRKKQILATGVNITKALKKKLKFNTSIVIKKATMLTITPS